MQEGFELFRVRGMPVRAHWSLLVGMIFFANGAGYPLASCIGIFALVLVHELGHATLVRIFGGRVVAITMHGFGGECSYVGHLTWPQRVVIAWGGVLGQAALGLLALALAWARLFPRTAFFLALEHALVTSNFAVAAFNLLPIPPLDGARAWAVVPLARDALSRARARWRARRMHS